MAGFSHFDLDGHAVMVDIGEKVDSKRTAVAKGSISMSRECLDLLLNREIGKGDVLGTARLAGIMGAKRTSDLIPLCHNIPITRIEIDFIIKEEFLEIEVACMVETTAKTGVEMEAFTGASISLLTIYDMCKAVDKKMEIKNVYLDYKSGGKSGIFKRNEK